jgi:hypothetical protein
MKDETKYFIEQNKLAQEVDKVHKQNVREFDDYFNNSGQTEKTLPSLALYQEYIPKKFESARKFKTRLKEPTKFDTYLKTLEVDLNKYIKHDDKEYW